MKLALFDLDGTLTRKDTLFEIIRYIHGNYRLYAGILLLSPILLSYKLTLLSNWKAKERILTYFFRNMSYASFQDQCNRFSHDKLLTLMKNDAIATLKRHKKEGTHVVVVSASAENWIYPWCEQSNITCVATRLEVTEGKLTGRIAGKNCHGIEKVNRIREAIDLSQYKTIYAYGDSKGDLPMLGLATHPNYRIFKI